VIASHTSSERRTRCKSYWEGADNTFDEVVAVRHDGAGAATYKFLEGRVEDGLVSRLGCFVLDVFLPYTHETVEECSLGLHCHIAITTHHSGGRLDRNRHDIRVLYV
jgi:hypothetical protein